MRDCLNNNETAQRVVDMERLPYLTTWLCIDYRRQLIGNSNCPNEKEDDVRADFFV